MARVAILHDHDFVFKNDHDRRLKMQAKKKMTDLRNIYMIVMGGTMGDRKPLVILSVLAASTLQEEEHKMSQIYMGGDTIFKNVNGRSRRFLPHLVDTYAFLLKLIQLWDPKHQLILEDDFVDLPFESGLSMWAKNSVNQNILDQPTPNQIYLDFGDNLGRNRFTSQMLVFRGEQSTFFGPIFLPLDVEWSNNLQTLKEFHDQPNAHFLVVAGSNKNPFQLQDMIQWIRDTHQTHSWKIIVAGYVNLKEIEYSDVKDRILVVKDYIEFEDLTRFADYFVTSCGAGSTTIALARGVPVTCSSGTGYDVAYNRSRLLELQLGVPYTETFADFMTSVQSDFAACRRNALVAQKVLTLENKLMMQNMKLFFHRLATDSAFQSEVVSTGNIPQQYALPKLETYMHQLSPCCVS